MSSGFGQGQQTKSGGGQPSSGSQSSGGGQGQQSSGGAQGRQSSGGGSQGQQSQGGQQGGGSPQNLQEMANVARDMAEQRIGEFRDTATEYYEQGRERVSELEESLETYVRNQPVKSVMIAVGVGLFLGVMLRR